MRTNEREGYLFRRAAELLRYSKRFESFPYPERERAAQDLERLAGRRDSPSSARADTDKRRGGSSSRG
jgi:hypothetical protein